MLAQYTVVIKDIRHDKTRIAYRTNASSFTQAERRALRWYAQDGHNRHFAYVEQMSVSMEGQLRKAWERHKRRTRRRETLVEMARKDREIQEKAIMDSFEKHIERPFKKHIKKQRRKKEKR